MQIEKNKVVTMHYSVAGADGAPIEDSRAAGQPIEVLVGHGGVIPGVEKALLGRSQGERFTLEVAAADGYGERQAGNLQRVPKKYFRDAARLRPGMLTALAMKQGGQRMVMVMKVGSSVIDVDLNHPLAGRDLCFDIEILGVRDADESELAHGHVHAPGGHAH
ncbi:MAG: peptidylprolyl isomerase [Xanthomonadales bacterium]|nr:peptidylprolyl isomerase [Xanthomonadales bacterium]